MILVFGGTTEGRKAAEVLEEAGSPYYYSTKTGERLRIGASAGMQDVTLHHGQCTDGTMDGEAMKRFCKENGIRLIVDAAHPFASVLHQTIGEVAASLQIPVIRFERIYPPRDPGITWIDDYRDLYYILPSLSREGLGVGLLLATTGVQSIAKLKPLEAQGIKVIYRILNRESSIELAHQQGATDDQLCYFEDGTMPHADAILMKESGLSGGFVEKVNEARARGMRIIAIKRPQLSFTNIVNGPHGLRRAVEHLLPEFFPLHSGLTTGTCATAATVAIAIRLLKGETPQEVPVLLPDGETITVPVGYADGYAYCIKEAGDDPDVTNGIEVRAEAYPQPLPKGGERVCIEAGKGIGRFTLPGFDYPPGESAINRVPREMIRKNLIPFISYLPLGEGLRVRLSVPNGEAIAHRTFNPRLGIEGGISIIGVSGIVKPYSEEAFIQSIRKCMEVAKAAFQDGKWQTANDKSHVVIGSGMKSEQQLRALYPDLPQQAFVEYGNYIGETLKMADELGFSHVTLGIMIGKAVKLAQGHLDTHSRRVTIDKAFIQQMLDEAHCQLSARPTGTLSERSGERMVNGQLTVARELWDLLSPDEADRFSQVVIRHCYEHCAPLLPNGELSILLLRNEA